MGTATLNFYDFVKNITYGKNKMLMESHISNPRFEKDFNKYMVLRYISMGSEAQKSVVFSQQQILEKLPCETAYRYLMKVVPRGSQFIRYVK